MYDIETLLSIEKNRSNKNPKFPNREISPTVFSRLGFNFTFPDPTITDLSDSAKDHLSKMPKLLKDWQAEDMRNNNAKDYYFNPVGSAASSIKSAADKIAQVSSYESTIEGTIMYINKRVPVAGLEDVYASANVLSTYAGSFKLHTDRLSNVVDIDVGEPPDPHYLTCSSIGRCILYIVNETDDIQDTRPVLGSFTSLFVTESIVELNNKIAEYPSLISDSISTILPGEGETNPTYSSNLSFSQVSTIVQDLNAASLIMGNRVAHDKNFWENSKKIYEEYDQFKIMNEEGESQKKIVEIIGTDKLKQSLLIEDLPNPIQYDAKMDYFGNVVYVPNTEYQYKITANSPLSIIDSYIDYYSNNTLIVTGPIDPTGNNLYKISLSNGAINLFTSNGMWSNTQSIILTNLSNTAYTISEIDVSNFEKNELKYELYPNNTVTILPTESLTFNVAARGITTESGIEYGIVKVIPGLDIQTRIEYKTESNIGILSPINIVMIYGFDTEKLMINANNGPYRILADTSLAPDYYTWINNSNNSVSISSIQNVTPSANSSDLTISLINADTATVNVGEKILWYANVIPNVVSPNNSIFKITTEDNQEKFITIGVYAGSVDDSSLYNETITTNPDIIAANGQPFYINIANGKPYTAVSYAGLDLSGTGLIKSNGTFSVYNSDGITSNGYYTYTFSFEGTGHNRNITKAIFVS